jgi:predicted ribosomally synthesized peptide with SipW-like signal peptide
MKISRQVKVVLALGSLSSAVWASTYASFTDSATAASTFTAGTVDLVLNGDASDAYSFTALQSSNLKPGDVVYAPLTIANTGTLGFTYTMTSSSTNTDGKGLKDTLTLGAKLVASTGACDAAGYAAAGTTVVTEAAISGAAISSARGLSASSSEVLCFKVTLPSSAGDTLQASTTTTTMTFNATQS